MRYPVDPTDPFPPKVFKNARRCGVWLLRRESAAAVRVIDTEQKVQIVIPAAGAKLTYEAVIAKARADGRWVKLPPRTWPAPKPRPERVQSGIRIELQLPADVLAILDRRAAKASVSRAGYVTRALRQSEARILANK